VSLLCTVILAKSFGCVLPLLTKRVGLDPAVAASPMITTLVDAASLFIFFSIASHVVLL
ncbi:MAG: magnesium transporter, partial [Clostridiales bacterium]|nr:magnesium transporter [Clostridiales bacterium]